MTSPQRPKRIELAGLSVGGRVSVLSVSSLHIHIHRVADARRFFFTNIFLITTSAVLIHEVAHHRARPGLRRHPAWSRSRGAVARVTHLRNNVCAWCTSSGRAAEPTIANIAAAAAAIACACG